MKIESLTPHLGAKVWGINLSEPMSDETFSQIQALMRDWSVLVFPDQELSQEDHKRFGARFGTLHTHPMHHIRADIDPHILKVKTKVWRVEHRGLEGLKSNPGGLLGVLLSSWAQFGPS